MTEGTLTAQEALVAIMITASASDSTIRTAELLTIQAIIDHLPVFATFGEDRLEVVAQRVFDLLEEEDGLDAIFALVRDALPASHHETAYALACDVAAADGKLMQAELALLREIRHELAIDPLHAAAIERGARARHLTL